jgi:hypothetical protein
MTKMTLNETSQEEYQRRANDGIDDATRSTDPKRRGGFFFALAETWVMLARGMTPPDPPHPAQRVDVSGGVVLRPPEESAHRPR